MSSKYRPAVPRTSRTTPHYPRMAPLAGVGLVLAVGAIPAVACMGAAPGPYPTDAAASASASGSGSGVVEQAGPPPQMVTDEPKTGNDEKESDRP